MAKIHPMRAYREAQNPPLTQEQLAKKLGIEHREIIARWEAGGRKIGQKYLAKIIRKTGISARELRPDLAELMEPV